MEAALRACRRRLILNPLYSMGPHKFKIGEMVLFRPSARGVDAPWGRPFQITQRLPVTGGQFQYRIRNEFENHERAASESELRPVARSI